jgi:hypothetical protein
MEDVMIYKLDLTSAEALFLKEQLARHLKEIDDELIHTDKHELQREIHREEDRLRVILRRLDALIEKSETVA